MQYHYDALGIGMDKTSGFFTQNLSCIFRIGVIPSPNVQLQLIKQIDRRILDIRTISIYTAIGTVL